VVFRFGQMPIQADKQGTDMSPDLPRLRIGSYLGALVSSAGPAIVRHVDLASTRCTGFIIELPGLRCANALEAKEKGRAE
jgi:hypothetical protein